MADLREVFEMTTKHVEPDQDSWKDQEHRQRRRARNRKISVMALVAALVIGIATVALLNRTDTGKTPADGSPTVSPALGTMTGLFTVDTESGAKTTFAVPRPDASQFEYSPDGSQVAYTALDEQGGIQVFVMDADGTNDHQLTRGTSSANPQWSPDGSLIAFANGYGIATIQPDGTRYKVIIPHTSTWVYTDAHFSPTASHIVYTGCHQTTSNFDVFRATAKGANRVNLTSTPSLNEFINPGMGAGWR